MEVWARLTIYLTGTWLKHLRGEETCRRGLTLMESHLVLTERRFTRIRFQLIKMRVFHTFQLQLPLWCSNLRVAEDPLFVLARLGTAKSGVYFFEPVNPPPPVKRRLSPHAKFRACVH
jgi:hypothetical protein